MLRLAGVVVLGGLLGAPAWGQEPAGTTGGPAEPVRRGTTSRAAAVAVLTPDDFFPATFETVSDEDLILLVRTARRAMRAGLLGQTEHVPTYRPSSLAGLKATIHLTLRRGGIAIAEAQSPMLEAIDAASAAGTLLARRARQKPAWSNQSDLRGGGDSLGLEFEWIGPEEAVAAKYGPEQRWSEDLLKSFDGGREGVGVRVFDPLRRGWQRWWTGLEAGQSTFDRVGRSLPGQILAANMTPDFALAAAEQQIRLVRDEKYRNEANIAYFRFPTHLVWQSQAKARPVRLVRGAEVVPPSAVDATGLDAAIARIGAYLRYRQRDNGWFQYEFLPSADRYAEGDSAAAQVHAMSALARYAAWSGQSADRESARKSLDMAVQKLRPVWVQPERAAAEGGAASQPVTPPTPGEQGWVLGHDGMGQLLESSARLAMALAAGEDLADYRAKRHGLLVAVQNAQDQDGRIEMLEASAGTEVAEDPLAAGVALQAIGRQAQGPDATVERVMRRAYAYYRPRLAVREATTQSDVEAVGPLAAMALVRGFAAGYPSTQDARHSDLVFNVLDALCDRQLTEANCPAVELRGAFGVRGSGDLGADSTVYLAALCDGCRLAERIGDQPRLERYREAIRRAARFVLQLEFRPSASYYVRSPRDVVGGIRAKPWDNRLRVDHVAEAVEGLIDAREILFGARESGKKIGKE